MDTNSRQETARIYHFPVKRTALGAVRRGQITTLAEQRSPLVPEVGGAWYHEAAVQEADRSRKP